MGRVPSMVLLSACMALFACTPDADPPGPEDRSQTDAAVRDAGQAARDAMKKAGDALRRLSGKPVEPDTSESTALPGEIPVTPETPEPEARPAPELPSASPASPGDKAAVKVIEPVPDETEQLEDAQHIKVERDASVATHEAKKKILEATRKAAERVRKASEGMVDAFRKDDLEADAASDTMDAAQAEPEAGPASTKTPPQAPRPE